MHHGSPVVTGIGSAGTTSAATVSSATGASSTASSSSSPAHRCRTMWCRPRPTATAATQFAAIGRPVIAPRWASTSLPCSVPAATTAYREMPEISGKGRGKQLRQGTRPRLWRIAVDARDHVDVAGPVGREIRRRRETATGGAPNTTAASPDPEASPRARVSARSEASATVSPSSSTRQKTVMKAPRSPRAPTPARAPLPGRGRARSTAASARPARAAGSSRTSPLETAAASGTRVTDARLARSRPGSEG